jgi:hypothetical protein
MMTATYALSGIGLLLTGVGFVLGVLDATTQTLAWSAVFFIASAAASSAVPDGERGVPARDARDLDLDLLRGREPARAASPRRRLFGALIETGSRRNVVHRLCDRRRPDADRRGFVAGASPVDAERKPLEEVAPPLRLGGGGHGCAPRRLTHVR